MSKAYGILVASTVPPATPTGLTSEEVVAGRVSLSWTDTGDATLWTVYRDGVPRAPVTSPFDTDDTVLPGTTYSYQVQAHNAGGSSALSAALPVTTPANSLASWSLGGQSLILNSGFSLDLANYCEDGDGQTLTFTKTSGNVPGLTLVGSVYSGTPTAVAAYPIVFDVYDGYDHVSSGTITFTVSDPDVTAPTVPTNVVASANGSTVTVTWDPSTDDSGIDHYRVFRLKTLPLPAETVYSYQGPPKDFLTNTVFEQTGVPDGTYNYKITAADASANLNLSAKSAASNSVVITSVPATPDTPINFTAVVRAASTSIIDLSWDAGSNGATPDDYDLDFSLTSATGPWTSIAFTGTATTKEHTGQNVGVSHWYRVRANAGALSSGYAASQILVGGTARFTIPPNTAARTFSGSKYPLTAGGTGTPVAGDIIELAAGTHGPLVFKGLKGATLNNRVTIRAPSSGIAIIRRANTGSGGFVLDFTDCKYFTIDGESSSASAVLNPKFNKRCGIRVTYATNATAGNKDNPSMWIKCNADDAVTSRFSTSSDYTMRCLHVDGGWPTYSNNGSGFYPTDLNQYMSMWPGAWHENIVFEGNYVERIYAGGFYLGSNWYGRDADKVAAGGDLTKFKPIVPVRKIKVRYNYGEHIGGPMINCKSWAGGTVDTNQVHDNWGRYTGEKLDGSANERTGMTFFDGIGSIFNNRFEYVGADTVDAIKSHGIWNTLGSILQNFTYVGYAQNDLPDRTMPSTFNIKTYNNVVAHCAQSGIVHHRGTNGVIRALNISNYNNTIYNAGENVISVDNGITGFLKNNLLISSPAVQTIGTCPSSNSPTSASFVNSAAHNFHLTANTPLAASGTVGVDISAEDIEGTTRSAPRDCGAYEFV